MKGRLEAIGFEYREYFRDHSPPGTELSPEQSASGSGCEENYLARSSNPVPEVGSDPTVAGIAAFEQALRSSLMIHGRQDCRHRSA